jgi:hypothetical protein
VAISTTVSVENGFARRESREVESKNPYGIQQGRFGISRRVEKTQGLLVRPPWKAKPVDGLSLVSGGAGFFLRAGIEGGRGGPIGVVKLLRARGGCLGVIRIRAWKAAISLGELPNERRSRNT